MSISQTLPQNVIDEFVGNAHGNLARVKELLTQYPALANANASWNESPIQAAAQTGQREIVNLLLAAGAPLDICTAAMMGRADRVAEFLRANPTQAHATGAHGLPVLYYPAINGRMDIAELLFANGASVNGGAGVSPPLHGAVYFNQSAMAEWLLDHGADVSARDHQGKTALQAALDHKRDDLAALIRKHGGKAMASGYVNVEGGQLHYETAGEGHPLVLIHAGVADSRMWDDQWEVFAQQYRVIRYDLRGFGQSTTETGSVNYRQDLQTLLEHLGVEPVSLLGCSMGGSLAVDFTLEHPELVAALIPVAAGLSGFDYQPGDDPKSQFEKQAFEQMDKLWEQHAHAELIEMELQMWVDGPTQSSDRVPRKIREKVRAMNETAYTQNADIKAVRLDPPAVARLAEIKAPTLVVVGDLDTRDVTKACDILAKGIVGARKVVISGTAHMLNMEKPAEFNRVVLDFLSGL